MKFVKILAMSYELKKIKDELMHNNPRDFASHCAKLMVCDYNYMHIEHWKKELFAFCSWIMTSTIKPNNKRVSKELIDEYYFGACCDSIGSYATALNIAWDELHLYGKRNTSKDTELFNDYRTFCNEVSKLLAKRTLTIYNIQELADKYITNMYRKLLGE